MGLTVSYHSVKAEIRFDSRPVRMGFVVYKVAQGQVASRSGSVVIFRRAPLPIGFGKHCYRTFCLEDLKGKKNLRDLDVEGNK